MGLYTYPCPSCWQTQRREIENGTKVRHALCPACQERADADPKSAEAKVKVPEG